MTHFENNNEEELEQLRIENELKKMKLMLERGAVFSESIDSNKLDPVVENEFLRNIEAYEESFGNSEQISVYNFIETPAYKLVETIPDSQIADELGKVMGILNEYGISLDTLCEVEDRELYRFITEELFLHEIDNVRIKGMMSCFIYEEFHPNHEYDIRNTSTEGITSYLDKENKYYTYSFVKEAEEESWFKDFRNAFDTFSLQKLDIVDIQIETSTAKVNFNIDFSAGMGGKFAKQRFSGDGYVMLIHQYDFWYINKIQFPEAE